MFVCIRWFQVLSLRARQVTKWSSPPLPLALSPAPHPPPSSLPVLWFSRQCSAHPPCLPHKVHRLPTKPNSSRCLLVQVRLFINVLLCYGSVDSAARTLYVSITRHTDCQPNQTHLSVCQCRYIFLSMLCCVMVQSTVQLLFINVLLCYGSADSAARTFYISVTRHTDFQPSQTYLGVCQCRYVF